MWTFWETPSIASKEENKEAPKANLNNAEQADVNAFEIWDPATAKLIAEKFPTPESKTESNMDNICKFALEQNISPNALLAYFYMEKNTPEKVNQAIVKSKTPENIVIQSQEEWTFAQKYEQIGSLENNTMTWAILDFTWSMSKIQIQAMIKTMLDLSKKWIITEKTTFNVMYDIADQDGMDKSGKKDPNADISVDKMKDTDKKISAIEFGKNGDGLKAYLMEKGLINETREVQKNGIWSTPLYTTILDNLMHSTVKDVTIFTDGASDRSADEAIGLEEVGNEDSWDAMIHLCKNYNKKINIVAFNVAPKYLERTNAMQEYFRLQWAEEYINVINLWQKTDAELSEALTKTISNNYDITIKEDQTMINGRTMSIVNAANFNKPNIVEMPIITKPDVQFTYDAQNHTYEWNLWKVFPGVDLSQYKIDYTINTSSKISQEQEEAYPWPTEKMGSFIIDVSSSMWWSGATLFKKAQLSSNPDISYNNLLSMQETIKGFRYTDNKYSISGFEMGDGTYNQANLDAIKFEKPNIKLCGLVLKSAKQHYTDLLNVAVGWSKEYDTYQAKIKEIDGYLQKVMAAEAIKTRSVASDLKKFYDEVLPLVDQDEVKKLYGYVNTLESIGGKDRTPILQTLSNFWDINFSKEYAWQTVTFFTDFGENSSEKNDKLLQLRDQMSSSDLTAYLKKDIANDDNGTKTILNKYRTSFEKSNLVQQLLKNLGDTKWPITIDFKYQKNDELGNDITNWFLRLLGAYMKEKANRDIFTFTPVQDNPSLTSLLYSEMVPTSSTYERNSITFNITPKEWSWVSVMSSQTVPVTEIWTRNDGQLLAKKQ